jgi:hypothetical protein
MGEPAAFLFQDLALYPEDKGNMLLRQDFYLRRLVFSMTESYRNEFICSE